MVQQPISHILSHPINQKYKDFQLNLRAFYNTSTILTNTNHFDYENIPITFQQSNQDRKD